jgi:hypothetical protein
VNLSRASLLAAAGGLLASMAAYTAPADAAPVPSAASLQLPTGSAAQQAAALRIIGGKAWTAGDLALVKQNRALAAHVPDPTQQPVTGVTTNDPNAVVTFDGRGGGFSVHVGPAPLAATRARVHVIAPHAISRAATEICGAWVDAYAQLNALTGGSLYRYHHRVGYCRNGSVVTRWQSRQDYFSNIDPSFVIKDREDNRNYGIGTNYAESYMSHEIDQCIFKYGCIYYHHPHIHIVVHGDGTYSYGTNAG